MKTTLIAPMTLILALSACQEEDQNLAPAAPPDAVVKAFKTAHGTEANATGWEMEDGNVEMEYLVNGKEVSELYDTDGNLISTERGIDPSTLPQAVRDAIATDAPGSTITAAESIVSEVATHYEVELRDADGVRELIYSDEGLMVGDETDDDAPGTEDDDTAP